MGAQLLVVEIDPDDVKVDESVFPNKWKDTFIYEHLRYYCSKFSPLPAISIYVTAEGATVTRAHQYLSIAKDLRRKSIRAIVDHNSPKEAVEQLLQKPSVTALDYQKLRAEEDEALFSYGWFVFFFERPLGAEERELFERKIVDYLKQTPLPPRFEAVERIKELNYPYAGHCAEVEAFTSLDPRWYGAFRIVLMDFHKNVTPIVSFQGTRFSSISL
jgi:hypothetical protein